jgi:hypothetical protein
VKYSCKNVYSELEIDVLTHYSSRYFNDEAEVVARLLTQLGMCVRMSRLASPSSSS